MGRKIITLSGPSGSGKSTIAKTLLADPEHFGLVRSYTTREPRPTDLPNEYAYVNHAAFSALRDYGELLWTTQVRDEFYFTQRRQIRSLLDRQEERTRIMILTPNVLRTLSDYVFQCSGDRNNVLHLFITTTQGKITERLTAAGFHPDQIAKRTNDGRNWAKEMIESGVFYYTVLNDRGIEETAGVIRQLLKN